jgi:hypothetical protein
MRWTFFPHQGRWCHLPGPDAKGQSVATLHASRLRVALFLFLHGLVVPPTGGLPAPRLEQVFHDLFLLTSTAYHTD